MTNYQTLTELPKQTFCYLLLIIKIWAKCQCVQNKHICKVIRQRA